MNTQIVDSGFAGLTHPIRSAAMGGAYVPADLRPGSFLLDIVSTLVRGGTFDYEGARDERVVAPHVDQTPPRLDREQARWFEDEPDMAIEASR